MKDGNREFIAAINADGGSPKTDFLAGGSEIFSFKDVTAREFELEGTLKAKVVLTSEPKVAQVIEKQLAGSPNSPATGLWKMAPVS